MVVCLLAQIQNFIGSQKFQNEKLFQAILSNFDFFSPDHHHPPPPPTTLSTENEITPDSAWHKLGPKKMFFKFLFKLFSIYFLFFTKSVSTRTKNHPNSKFVEPKCVVGDACDHLHNFKKFIRFQKFQYQNVFQVILSNFDFLTTTPPPPPS